MSYSVQQVPKDIPSMSQRWGSFPRRFAQYFVVAGFHHLGRIMIAMVTSRGRRNPSTDEVVQRVRCERSFSMFPPFALLY